MIVARAYYVLDMVTVELSCIHPDAPERNHLLIREERRGLDVCPRSMLVALGDVAQLADWSGQQPCEV